MTNETQPQEMTDGFHLIIDGLKLNGIDTIFGLPGIPITDFARKAQAAGMRVISFRHEQNAGNAAAIAGFMTQKPGVCLTVSAPGFLNGLTALTNATTNCFPMILMSGSSEREIVDLQQGDYVRAAALGFEALITLHLKQQNPSADLEDYAFRDDIKKQLESLAGKNWPDYKLLRNIRNSLSHANRDKTKEVQQALANEERLNQKLSELFCKLLPATSE